MNELSKQTKRPHTTMPPIAARLDLADEGQRRLHDLIHRFHTGRWPVFRCLGMRQVDGVIYEAVEWLRMAQPSFAVVTWRADGLGLSWRDAASTHGALTLLNSQRRQE